MLVLTIMLFDKDACTVTTKAMRPHLASPIATDAKLRLAHSELQFRTVMQPCASQHHHVAT